MTKYELIFTLNCLAGETDIHPSLLMENEEFRLMILNRTPYAELLEFVNENF